MAINDDTKDRLLLRSFIRKTLRETCKEDSEICPVDSIAASFGKRLNDDAETVASDSFWYKLFFNKAASKKRLKLRTF